MRTKSRDFFAIIFIKLYSLCALVTGWNLQIKTYDANQNGDSEQDEEETIKNDGCKMPLILLRFFQLFFPTFLVKPLQNISNLLDLFLASANRVHVSSRRTWKTFKMS
jgi:hypothetical protein